MSEPKKLKSENKMLKLQEDEYQLEMSLYDDNSIEFKVTLNSPMANCYYSEKYDLETIKKISYLTLIIYNNIESVYKHYKDKIFPKKEMNLILSPNKNIMSLKYQKTVDEEDIEVELKLEKKMAEKNEIVQALMKEVEQLKKTVIHYEKKIEELKKNNDLLMEEIKKIKEKEKEEEKIKIEDEKNEEKLEKEEEKFSSLNGNVNLVNNFKFENFPELENVKSVSSDNRRFQCKTVAVYCMTKNNKRLYQMAYAKNKYHGQKMYSCHIIIYNLVTNKIENKIYVNRGERIRIDTLQHYYDSSTKNHILLSSCWFFQSNPYPYNYQTSLWNISSDPIENILNINDNCYKPCIIFKNVDFFVFGYYRDKTDNYSSDNRMCAWDKNGSLIKTANKSKLKYLKFAEAAYVENKSYVLLSGQGDYDNNIRKSPYFAECYIWDEDEVRTYKDDENNDFQIYCINLFKKGNDIFFITGFRKNVNIFEFESTKLKTRIELGESIVYSLCSISEKYMIALNDSMLKIIDMENHSVVDEYSAHEDGCEKYQKNGIQKIKIPEKCEFIISLFGINCKIWKL